MNKMYWLWIFTWKQGHCDSALSVWFPKGNPPGERHRKRLICFPVESLLPPPPWPHCNHLPPPHRQAAFPACACHLCSHWAVWAHKKGRPKWGLLPVRNKEKVGPRPHLYFNDNATCQHRTILLGSDHIKVHTQHYINSNGNNEKRKITHNPTIVTSEIFLFILTSF